MTQDADVESESPRQEETPTSSPVHEIVLIQSCFRRWQAHNQYKRRCKPAPFRTRSAGPLTTLLLLGKMVAKRKNVANELLHTEREYTNNLSVLVEVRAENGETDLILSFLDLLGTLLTDRMGFA